VCGGLMGVAMMVGVCGGEMGDTMERVACGGEMSAARRCRGFAASKKCAWTRVPHHDRVRLVGGGRACAAARGSDTRGACVSGDVCAV
jgi:hypothetical protein